MKKATCVYIIDTDTQEVLMAKKTRKVGVGCWFGYGGKIDEGETPQDCTIRETYIESGEKITLSNEELEPIALIDFYNYKHLVPGNDDPSFRVLFYRVLTNKERVGTAVTTDEMADPTWFRISEIPWDQMISGDDLFIPQLLLGVPIKGWIHFSEDDKEVLGSSIAVCSLSELIL